MSAEEIKDFIAQSKIDQPATVEEFHQAVKDAYKDRTRQVYFIWKTLKELGQTSRGGLLVFEQTIEQLEDDKAVKIFHCCPHVEALTELGLSKEEIKMFCRDMLGHCDYAICEPCVHVDIDFPATIADGEGHGCAMTITRKKDQ